MSNSLGLPGKPQDHRVVVAMSGGVDSSVVAGMMAREGFEVVGMTMQLYDHGAAVKRKGACCAGQDIADARLVADRLGIAHYVLDYEDRFRNQVMEEFADSYLAGETPVPCISCNQTVKFSDLLTASKDLGASALVTGHYIQTRLAGNHRALYRPVDQERDQSYFLFATTQDQLDYVRFPLGGMSKAEVRKLAREFGLIVADKQDSQDICFVPDGRYGEVIKRLRPEAAEAGDIVDLNGKRLGTHNGIINYTIGQRRGLGIAVGDPIYVVAIDAAQKRVIVGPRSALDTATVSLRDVNWIGPGSLDAVCRDGLEISARLRSTRPPSPARLRVTQTGCCEVDLLTAERGVSPGQACVFYENDGPEARVLGGGWIASTDRVEKIAQQTHRLLDLV